MEERFNNEGKFLETQRIQMRTRYDLEMLTEVGYCSGIENYSVYLSVIYGSCFVYFICF